MRGKLRESVCFEKCWTVNSKCSKKGGLGVDFGSHQADKQRYKYTMITLFALVIKYQITLKKHHGLGVK